MSAAAWTLPERLPNPGAPERVIDLVADEAQRAAVARQLDLPAVHRLEARVRLKPWLDGAEMHGRWASEVAYVCGLTLEPFDQKLEGEFSLKLVPQGSRNAPSADAEMTLDPQAPEPPDVLEGDTVDVAAYVVEHLALEIDPFPRKPGATFVQPPEPEEVSPFAKLAALKPPGSA